MRCAYQADNKNHNLLNLQELVGRIRRLRRHRHQQKHVTNNLTAGRFSPPAVF